MKKYKILVFALFLFGLLLLFFSNRNPIEHPLEGCGNYCSYIDVKAFLSAGRYSYVKEKKGELGKIPLVYFNITPPKNYSYYVSAVEYRKGLLQHKKVYYAFFFDKKDKLIASDVSEVTQDNIP